MGVHFEPVQENHSRSKSGVIRAIHAERWNKLVYPTTGKMYAAIVDLRPASRTFGEFEQFLFDNTGPDFPSRSLFLPNGMGNSICAIEGPVDYHYLTDDYWTPGSSFGIRWNDPDLNIPWPIKEPIINPKDKELKSLRQEFDYMFKPMAILGGGGLIGSVAVDTLKQKGVNFEAPPRKEVDITDKEAVEKWMQVTPAETVILFSAWTDVDGAEKDKEGAEKVNVAGTRNVAEAANKYGKHLVYISTDFIFPGTEEEPGPYNENRPGSPTSPDVSTYGRTKALGEREVLNIADSFTIIRISYPFGNPNSEKDFALKTLGYIEKGYPLFADQVFTPTYIPDLVAAVRYLGGKKIKGVFHVACQPATSPYEFGSYLAAKLGKTVEIKKGSMKDFLADPKRTRRPLKGGLDTSMSDKELGRPASHWQRAIDDFVEKLKAKGQA
jgi:dTDP-4-dehydrorhamnose reductase/dTDP-4-dehydrorhamnose 3,5-epimerase